jgi:hypothetical protein
MKIKVSEASRHVLDWMVKTAAGFSFDGKIWSDGRGYYYLHSDSPSTDWAQGGPILEREKIAVTVTVGSWSAFASDGEHIVHGVPVLKWKHKATGPTPLIAAMRCFVASKLGDEVDVPEELK